VELKRLLEIFLRRWPIILVTFAVTVALTFWWVDSKPDSYRASGTYVVRPRLDQTGQIDVRAIEALIKGVEIPATYASIARSDVVRERGKEALGRDAKKSGLSVGAEVITGTNTVEISAHAPDAQTAHDFALAIGTETAEYIDALNDTYRLELLDPPRVPTEPVDVKRNLTLAIGAVFGLVLGFTVAFSTESFGAAWRTIRSGRGRAIATSESGAPPLPDPDGGPSHATSATTFDDDDVDPVSLELAQVIDLAVAARASDPVGNGHGQSREFMNALDKAYRSGTPHSLGVLKLEFPSVESGNGKHPSRDDDRITRLMRSCGQSSGGTSTYLDDGVFAVLLPGLSAPAATKLLADWSEMLSIYEYENDRNQLEISIGVREFPRRSMWSVAPAGKARGE
jgi:capsular polysaccharide biosynthesis protein